MIGWLSTTLDVATFAVTVLGLGGLFLQIRSASKGQEKDHLRQRQQATLDWASVNFERQYVEESGLPELHDFEACRAYAANPLDLDSKANREIVHWIEMMEDLATGVNIEVYDRMVVERLIGPRVMRGWRNFAPWVYTRRALKQQDTLYCEFERLAKDIYATTLLTPDLVGVPEFADVTRTTTRGPWFRRLLRWAKLQP